MWGKNTKDTRRKSLFQQELERSVSRRIFRMIVIGCLCFCIAMAGVSFVSNKYNQERYLNDISKTFYEACNSTESFLTEKENVELFICSMQTEHKKGDIRYRLSQHNLDAPVYADMILTDRDNNIIFTSFSEEQLNLHKIEFNNVVAKNAMEQERSLYHAVYYFSGSTSEYIIAMPLYEGMQYEGNVSLYLNGMDWNQLFSSYQYDSIITGRNGDIIYCSNTGFLSERNNNKYKPERNTHYIWVEGQRYMTDMRTYKVRGITIYSFIYSPPNFAYFAIGVVTILVLGVSWTLLFFYMSQTMAEKTAASVGLLVKEMRIIRTEDTEHVVSIHTGDEFEEIADHINRMVSSINDLNERNLELATVNSKMELQNLQAQINPHFIYNTLDNIKYLIIGEPMRAAEMIERFTHILRYSINNTKQRVTLEEDMHYIEDYLAIQKMRFEERFSYEIFIPVAYNRCCVPKLLLQPLLENSIKYGFKKKNRIHLQIRGEWDKGYLILRVEDDGPGVPKAMLETLQGMMRQATNDSSHIGLQSISRRIALEYGKESTLIIESMENEGFIVILKLWMGGANV